MNSKTLKRQRDLKNKLMAAISMLLVSSIMLVTSTYAWFTLSTAPEVTGITTAVGANGNLEMALLPLDGETSTIDFNSGVGDSINKEKSNVEEANVTWGNLVDLSNNTIYGLDQITLYPSALNLQGDTIQAALLTIPEYGADGRVSVLAADTLTGVYDGSKFTPDTDNALKYGVRAVGTASGMTDRQLDYRNARSAANTARTQAANAAATALNANGSKLANIAIEYGMGAENASYDKNDVAALRAIVDALQKDDGVLDLIEKAYMQYILAYAASAASGTEDTAWTGVKALVEADSASLSSVMTEIDEYIGSDKLPSGLTDMIDDYNSMVTSVSSADNKITQLETTIGSNSSATFTWTEIRDAMTPLVDPSQMLINGFKASEVKANISALVSSVTEQGGLKVIMMTSLASDGTKNSAGVFADIADHTMDYDASIVIEEVSYNGVVLNNMKARMETDSYLAPNYYLVTLGTAVTNALAPASGATGNMPITDMYGYVVDLAFRTNAAESNLLLQQTAVDRIYSDNTNEDTMGHGATMTFKATTTDFSNDQVKALMSAIRIVFFDTDSQKVITYAKLDTANATFDTSGWTSKICLYENSVGGQQYRQVKYGDVASGTIVYERGEDTITYTEVTGEVTADNFKTYSNLYTSNDNGTTYTAVTSSDIYDSSKTYYAGTTTVTYTEITDKSGLTSTSPVYIYETVEAGEVLKSDNVIMPLTQNSAHKLSVLVYLDGEKVTNGSVAATAATSVTGSMNLQFSSSATLVPMDYADLHTPVSSTTTYNVTVPTGATGNATATAGQDYTFTVDTANYTLSTVTVGGTTVTPTDNGSGSYTIPAASVTGAIVINVTANGNA